MPDGMHDWITLIGDLNQRSIGSKDLPKPIFHIGSLPSSSQPSPMFAHSANRESLSRPSRSPEFVRSRRSRSPEPRQSRRSRSVESRYSSRRDRSIESRSRRSKSPEARSEARQSRRSRSIESRYSNRRDRSLESRRRSRSPEARSSRRPSRSPEDRSSRRSKTAQPSRQHPMANPSLQDVEDEQKPQLYRKMPLDYDLRCVSRC